MVIALSCEVEVVDQRDIQRLGGKAVDFPLSALIKQLLDENSMDYSFIFDVTYGEGRFYGYFRNEIDLLVGADVGVWDWVVEPDLFIRKPVWSSYKVLKKLGLKPSLIVVDPPFQRGVRYNKRKMFSYVLGGPHIIVESAIKACRELSSKHVLIHWDRIETFNRKLVAAKGCKICARYLHDTNQPSYFYILEV